MEKMMDEIRISQLIAIIRGVSRQVMASLFSELYEGGIRLAEITMNSPEALRSIHDMRERFGDRMRIGAGTVLNRKMAWEAVSAGAEFLVSPHLDAEVVSCGLENGALPIPGVLTPTEVVKAVQAGVPVVKLFPCSSVGPGYVREIRGPLDDVPIIAVGGVHPGNARDFLDAGAIAVGVGGGLLRGCDSSRGDFAAAKTNTERMLAALQGKLIEQ